MKRTLFLLSIFLVSYILVFAQQGVALNKDGSLPNNSAVLDLTSPNQGFLIPRMTEAQKNAINNPAISLLVFQTNGTLPGFYYYSCYGWQHVGSLPAGSGCAIVASVNVDNNVSTNGGSDGQATVTQTCAIAPITYLWSDNQITQTAVGLSAGSYCVTITDANSCTFTDCVFISEPSGPPAFVCGDPLIDIRDGKVYTTVQIGTQCWMAENLNIGTQVHSLNNNQTNNSIIEKFCDGNSSLKCDIYGGLYQWQEMMDYVYVEGTQGICPVGWHVPTDAEWCILENFVDSGIVSCNTTSWRGANVGGALKSLTTDWNSPNTGATNSAGFNGLPGGYASLSGGFPGPGNVAYFWSSSESGTGQWGATSIGRGLSFLKSQVYRGVTTDLQSSGYSVRCVMD
ncbi:MAG: hypothetical protein MK207_15890 [Saprospiraceae bacterium]|nr:hypothetical protein [Saprospiraceae bacterium]